MIIVSFDFLHVVVPTLEVVATWGLFVVLFLGIGHVVRRLIAPLIAVGNRPTVSLGDSWIGLVGVCIYLQVWNLVLPIDRAAWVVPLAVAPVGLLFWLRPSPRNTLRRLRHVAAAADARAALLWAGVALGVVWLANRTLAADANYDDGLYHLGIVRYSMDHHALPGLANLHERLGAADPNLLLVSLVSRASSMAAGVHLVNGLLAAMLLLDCARFARRSHPARAPFATTLALLTAAATVLVAAINPGGRVSSADIDFATYVVVAAGALYLADAVETRNRDAVVTSTALLSLAAVIRPLYWLGAIVALAMIVVTFRRRGSWINPRFLVAASVLPTALAIAWVLRQSVLSGYPFFPLTVVGLPVDWRVPRESVVGANRWIYSWARHPGLQPDSVLGSWHWLRWWLHERIHDADVLAPLALLVVTVRPRSFRRRMRDPRFADQSAALLSVLVPAVAILIAWFFAAPDPRFALAPIWAIPISLAAFGIATDAERRSGMSSKLVVVVVVGVAGFTIGAALNGRLYALALIALGIGIAVLIADLRRLRRTTFVVYAVPAVLAVAAGAVSLGGAFTSVTSQPDGVFGMSVTTPIVTQFRTQSGAMLSKPTTGDQCWALLGCTPYPDPSLAFRGSDLSSGFRIDHGGSASSAPPAAAP